MKEVPLALSDGLRQQLLAHVRAELPNEACAFLLGTSAGTVVDILPVENELVSPHRYSVSSGEVVRVYDHAEALGLEVVGVAHSHPTGPAVPSPVDESEALVSSWLYLVVGSEGEIRAYRPD